MRKERVVGGENTQVPRELVGPRWEAFFPRCLVVVWLVWWTVLLSCPPSLSQSLGSLVAEVPHCPLLYSKRPLAYEHGLLIPEGSPQPMTCSTPLPEDEEWKSWLKTQHSGNYNHGFWSHHFMENRWGNSGYSERLCFLGAPKSLQMVTTAMKLKDTCSLEEKLWPT